MRLTLGYQQSFQVLLDYWDDVLQPLSSDTRRYLVDQLSQLEQVQSEGPADLAWELGLVLDHVLPREDHPARQAIEAAEHNDASGPADWQALTSALRDRAVGVDLQPNLPPSPDEVTFWIGKWLLGQTSFTEYELRQHGQAPDDPDLIRLERRDGSEQWPAFQFAPDGSPHPLVRTVNRLLDANEDPWGAADWWLGHNQWLDDVPARLIDQGKDDSVIAAAKALDPVM